MPTNQKTKQKNVSAQEIQDEIFRKMNADEKIKLGAGLWHLGKELNPNHCYYGRNYRSARHSRGGSKYS